MYRLLCVSVPLCEICLLIGCLGITGCGGKTAPVHGKLKFKDGSDAAALAGYTVNFESTQGKTSGSGEVQPDGTFKVSTFGADDGAVPGAYKVAITPPQSSDPDKPPPKSKIAAKYTDFSSSGLTVEVKPGRNDVTLEVDSAQ
jgi:hypothetical protein